LELPAERGHYLKNVMRLKVGAPLRVFDGKGTEMEARVAKLERSGCELHLGESVAPTPESPLCITLYQGLSRGERMDYSIQKATELGALRVVPVIMSRSGVKLDAQRRNRRVSHWQSVASAACEQCGRATVPTVTDVMDVSEMIADSGNQPCLYLDPESARGLGDLQRPETGLGIAVGPEGGMDPREIELMAAAGLLGVRLGPRILRTETAGPAAVAAAQLLWGDLG
jgi:16S rRNA (uracil1498-N3)-methyltransferase